MNLRACLALCISWSVAMPAAADAGAQPWVFVPIAVGGLPVARASALTVALEAAVVSAGSSVLQNDDAVERIRLYSAESTVLPPDTLNTIKHALVEEQNELAVHPAAAARALEGLSLEQRDAAAQDPSLAQQMEAICLTRLEYDVRMRADSKAQKQAELCRTLFPALQPEAGAYPPPVLAELNNAPRHEVRVDGPSGCDVVLNGKVVGAVPAALSLFAGPARLQLRCAGRTTRVHPVVFGQREQIAIDPVFDAALHTDRGLYLTTESIPIVRVGQWLDARVVPLRVQIIDGRIRVQLSAAHAGSSAARRSLWYDLLRGYDERDVSAAADALLQGGYNTAPSPVATSVAVPAAPAPSSTVGVPTGAIILGGAGAAMLAGGLVTGLMGRARDADVRHFAQQCPAPCDPPPEQRVKLQQLQSEVRTLYTTTNVLAVAGGVTVAAAVGWLLLWPKKKESERVSITPFASLSDVGARMALRF